MGLAFHEMLDFVVDREIIIFLASKEARYFRTRYFGGLSDSYLKFLIRVQKI